MEGTEIPEVMDMDPTGYGLPEEEEEIASPFISTNIDNMRISQVLKILTPENYQKAFEDFDNQLEETIRPLRQFLKKDLLSTDVSSINNHMTYVNSWRERIVFYYALATAFVEHSKSSHFSLHATEGKRPAQDDRDAYRKTLSAGFVAWQKRLEGTLDTIDERVNVCKKLFEREAEKYGIRT